MIVDVIENARLYLGMHDRFAKAFAFLRRRDLLELDVGRHPIDGDRIYSMVAREQGRKKRDAKLEVHEKYIDIQFVLEGIDNMGWKPVSLCSRPTSEYDREKDIRLFADEPDIWFPTGPGMFAVFFPEDAHMPLISQGMLHKVVVKVAVS